MYITRHLEQEILKASRYYPVVMVCGLQQVGKSTLLYHIKDSTRQYVTLADPKVRRLALNDPALFFETYGTPLLIDDFEYVPSILLEMKKLVDKKALAGEDCSGMFWLISSQKFNLMQGVSDSLAGRMAIFELSSLSSAEIEARPHAVFKADLNSLHERLKNCNFKNIHQIYEDIFRGGLPKLRTSKLERERFYAEYINNYLEREIRSAAQVLKVNEFYDFLVLLASHTAQELNYKKLAISLDVSAPTIKYWIFLLERSGMNFLLYPYFNQGAKRLVKRPKVYFMDTGLVAYLARWPNAQTLEKGALDLAILKTYVVSEIVKSYLNAGLALNLFYYRDWEQHEIDLLIVGSDKIYPIEIKKNKAPSNVYQNFSGLKQSHKEIAPLTILCQSKELIPYSKEAWYCPLSVF